MPTAEDCRQYALSRNETYAAWGWLASGGCLLVPTDFAGFKGNRNRGVKFGCLNPKERMEWGCSTTLKLFPQVPKSIDVVVGYSETDHLNFVRAPREANVKLAETCRQYALDRSATYAAWGWLAYGGCVLVPKPFRGFKGDGNSGAKFGCLNPGEKVEWGCSTAPRVNYIVKLTKEVRKNEAAKETVISQINAFGGIVYSVDGDLLVIGEIS